MTDLAIVKHEHACVRLTNTTSSLVIDPEVWSGDKAFVNVDAVLLTHEHDDHVDVSRIAALSVPIYAPRGARVGSLETIGLAAGQSLDLAGFRVTAVGGRHARIHGEEPDCPNLGFVIDERIYHPGDSLFIPDHRIDTVLVPIAAPWLKVSESIAFISAIRPERAIGIHDGQWNGRGLASVNNWLERERGVDYIWLEPGRSIP